MATVEMVLNLKSTEKEQAQMEYMNIQTVSSHEQLAWAVQNREDTHKKKPHVHEYVSKKG